MILFRQNFFHPFMRSLWNKRDLVFFDIILSWNKILYIFSTRCTILCSRSSFEKSIPTAYSNFTSLWILMITYLFFVFLCRIAFLYVKSPKTSINLDWGFTEKTSIHWNWKFIEIVLKPSINLNWKFIICLWIRLSEIVVLNLIKFAFFIHWRETSKSYEKLLFLNSKGISPVLNPFMPTGAFNICCPRDAVSRTANVKRTGRHKWVKFSKLLTESK